MDAAKEKAKVHTYDDFINLYISVVPQDKWFAMPNEDINKTGNTETKANVNEVETAETKMLRTALLNKWLDNEFDSYRQAKPDEKAEISDANKVLEKYREEHNILI
jgi:hypothetical protein